jgi:hypothetical protein
VCGRNQDPSRTTTPAVVCDHAGTVINTFSLGDRARHRGRYHRLGFRLWGGVLTTRTASSLLFTLTPAEPLSRSIVSVCCLSWLSPSVVSVRCLFRLSRLSKVCHYRRLRGAGRTMLAQYCVLSQSIVSLHYCRNKSATCHTAGCAVSGCCRSLLFESSQVSGGCLVRMSHSVVAVCCLNRWLPQAARCETLNAISMLRVVPVY